MTSARVIWASAAIAIAALLVLGLRYATFGGGCVLSGLLCLAAPLAPVVLAALVARFDTWDRARLARRELASIPDRAEDELHLILAVVPAAPLVPPQHALVRFVGQQVETASRISYVRRARLPPRELERALLDRLEPVVGVAVAAPGGPAYRATTASVARAPAATGVRVIAVAFVTPATGTVSAAPETLADARALLRALEPYAERAMIHACVVPNDAEEGLDPVAIDAAFARATG